MVSRLFTAIYYIEDIDSLRFALSIQDYDLAKIQPHFPGYPVFCFLVKVLYFFTGSLAQSFSLIGGISVFMIILYTNKIFSTKLNSSLGFFISSIIFFNPMIWLMSNRYMPDLFGFALACMILCSLIRYDNSISSIYSAFFFSGLMLGVRLSYFPIIFFALLAIIFKNKYSLSWLISYFILGIIIWLVPILIITGPNDLISIAKNHTLGHFYDYGGSVITDNDLNLRILRIIESIGADGFGGYWPGRSTKTLFVSVIMGILSIVGIRQMIKNIKFERSLLLILLCSLIYLVWIFVSQNVIYKSRHILPILLFVFLILSYGYEYLLTKNRSFAKIIVSIFVVFLIQITYKLTHQHTMPTAISQVKEHIKNKGNLHSVISTPLINFYLKTHMIDLEFVDASNEEEIERFIINNSDSTAIIIGDFQQLFKDQFVIKEDSVFYHNPYVNRTWSSIDTYLQVGKK